MDLNIRGEKQTITEAMKEYANNKLAKLSKYIDKENEVTAYVLFKMSGPKQKLEITIPLKSLTLRVEEEAQDYYAAVDTSVDKLERQIRKNKTKMQSKKMKEYKDIIVEQIEPVEEDEVSAIVKRKKVELKPMDEEEAVVQMELLGHDFHIFKDLDTGKIEVVYRRKDGNYGIIETE